MPHAKYLFGFNRIQIFKENTLSLNDGSIPFLWIYVCFKKWYSAPDLLWTFVYEFVLEKDADKV